MMRKIKILHIAIMTLVLTGIFSTTPVSGQTKDTKVGVDERLGNKLPLELEFQTSEGDTVKLKELTDTPFLLALVYYECPGICSPLLTALASSVENIQLKPKEDFKVISVSIDPRETPAVAREWKKEYFTGMRGEFPEDAWIFLTSDSKEKIDKLASSAGFRYSINEDSTYLHPGVVTSISPKGKISRYIFYDGKAFNPFDLKMALLEAESGKTNPAITKALKLCYSYDPSGRGYSLNFTRIFGVLMLLGVGVFVVIISVKKTKKKNKGNA
jgi:protein SCO1/2